MIENAVQEPLFTMTEPDDNWLIPMVTGEEAPVAPCGQPQMPQFVH